MILEACKKLKKICPNSASHTQVLKVKKRDYTNQYPKLIILTFNLSAGLRLKACMKQ